MSSQLGRLVLLPATLFVVYSGGAFTLAKLHPAKPGVPAAAPTTVPTTVPTSGSNTRGDSSRGQSVYSTSCASCHGDAAEGGVGPKLAGANISLAAARAQIDNGSGSMPAKLVQGSQEDDLLAYLATILAPSG